MALTDVLIIGGVIGAFITFAVALGWVSYDYKRNGLAQNAHGDD